jgi:hypothetical protein
MAVVGLDANADGRLDLLMAWDGSGGSPQVRLLDPGTGSIEELGNGGLGGKRSEQLDVGATYAEHGLTHTLFLVHLLMDDL